MNLEQEIIALKERNAKVEQEKAWETSFTRRFFIVLLTYLVMLCVFYAIDSQNPWMNAIIPTLGFFLSTLSLTVIKSFGVQYFQ